MIKFNITILFTITIIISIALPFFAIEKGEALTGTPIVDGKADDIWTGAVSYPVNKLKTGYETNLISEFKVLWDSNNLYFFIKVKDPEITYSGDASNAKDGVEIYLDPMLVKTDNYSAEPRVMQCFITAPANAEMSYTGASDSIKSFMIAANKAFGLTDMGYIIEASFDLKTICPDLKMQPGTVIGLDIQVNDQDPNTNSRAAAYGWSDDSDLAWQTSSVLGEITLSEEAVQATAAAIPFFIISEDLLLIVISVTGLVLTAGLIVIKRIRI